ncbi:pre-mRNA processing RNA-helicase [Borealophlyctis nickersoniae]|nr:pre-mRNA processing RNA-helicase [Borealophlyctis nickersoniae]
MATKTVLPFSHTQSTQPSISAIVNDAEEKIRQRRERIRQWQLERAQKDAAESGQLNGTASPSGDTTTPAKKWSLEDDEEDEDSNATPVKDIAPLPTPLPLPSMRPVSQKPAPPPTSAKRPLTKPVFGKPAKASIFTKTQLAAPKPKVKARPSISFDDGDDDDGDVRQPAKRLRIGKDQPPVGIDTKDSNGMDVDEEDALERFMVDVNTEVEKLNSEEAKSNEQNSRVKEEKGGDASDDEEEEEGAKEEIGSDPEDLISAVAKRIEAKRKDLAQVDHSAQNYEPFRKDFFIEPAEFADLTEEQVDDVRAALDGIKIRGHNCPKPIEKWTQFGLPIGVHEVIRKVLKYEKPTPIQAQAIPAVMSGRDVIGIAKTGSGKTIAFLLPMLRHIKDQRPLEPGEGPIALIMTPTRELAVQIHKECKPFAKVLNMRAVCCYGGAPIKDQIAELKRGAEVIICTPGRMIDLLCANSGRVTNLRRVTYLVLDEADRMFDMGFEPQVMKMVNNVRPDRQTILFSATFPRKMEALARKILIKPLEITVGGRSVVAADVEQVVEVLEEDDKFVRLLGILGDAGQKDPDDKIKILIFVDRQEAADSLLSQLIKRGYPCQSLHGGKDQADRDSTISDFKSGMVNILIATSVASRGLDVKGLNIVINYDCPNHMEDYVHRVGRTGRAGNKGTAYTFITSDQDKYAVEIMKALTNSGTTVPDSLMALADSFLEKVKAGSAQYAASGFGGKGLERLDNQRDLVKKIQKKSHGGQYGDDEEDEEDIEEKIEASIAAANEAGAAGPATAAPHTPASASPVPTANGAPLSAAIKAAQEAAAKINAQVGAGAAKARDVIAEINAKFRGDGGAAGLAGEEKKASEAAFALEIPINDYPQKARWRVTNKEQISQITEISGAAITTRGTYFPPGKQPGPGERKLYLFIEGDSQLVIDKAKVEIKRIITEATIASMESEAAGGRYQVLGGPKLIQG